MDDARRTVGASIPAGTGQLQTGYTGDTGDIAETELQLTKAMLLATVPRSDESSPYVRNGNRSSFQVRAGTAHVSIEKPLDKNASAANRKHAIVTGGSDAEIARASGVRPVALERGLELQDSKNGADIDGMEVDEMVAQGTRIHTVACNTGVVFQNFEAQCPHGSALFLD